MINNLTCHKQLYCSAQNETITMNTEYNKTNVYIEPDSLGAAIKRVKWHHYQESDDAFRPTPPFAPWSAPSAGKRFLGGHLVLYNRRLESGEWCVRINSNPKMVDGRCSRFLNDCEVVLSSPPNGSVNNWMMQSPPYHMIRCLCI